MGRSAITYHNQSRIIHALASLAPHLDICADSDQHCVHIEKCNNKECHHLLDFLGNDSQKPLNGTVDMHEIAINAIDLEWLEAEARRTDPRFKPLAELSNAVSAELTTCKYN
jgi:hypothetical protein